MVASLDDPFGRSHPVAASLEARYQIIEETTNRQIRWEVSSNV
jgi:hypothetical protein